MKTVLAPIDFSSVSESVVREAIALARVYGARVVVLHVVMPPPVVATNFGMVAVSDPLASDASEDAGQRLRQLQRTLQAEGFTVHAVHVTGEPGQCIVTQAERLDADLVVMGSHGHHALYEFLIGSTTDDALRRLRCPVVLVPPPVERAAATKEVAKPARAR
jgi:nucleotide-binding universal stress UspA family protein